MKDEPEPPRKFYGFKPAEFEAANEPPRDPPPAAAPSPDPGIVAVDTGRIEVRELARQATGEGPLLGCNAPANRPNEVHAILRDNLARANAAGLNDVKIDPNYVSKRRRRIQRFCVAIVAIDGGLGFLAWRVGHGNAFAFTFAIAGIGYISARLIWTTFFLRTD